MQRASRYSVVALNLAAVRKIDDHRSADKHSSCFISSTEVPGCLPRPSPSSRLRRSTDAFIATASLRALIARLTRGLRSLRSLRPRADQPRRSTSTSTVKGSRISAAVHIERPIPRSDGAGSPTPPTVKAEPPEPGPDKPADWRDLLMRLTGLDVTRCSKCGGALYSLPLKRTPTKDTS